jgi:predicted nucleic acid-binding protein
MTVPASTERACLSARPVVDGLMAATALVHGWTLVTRNVSDVASTGVRLLDPFTRIPTRLAPSQT